MKILILSIFLLSSLYGLGYSDSETASQQPVIDDHYSGGFKNDFPTELATVRNLVGIVPQEIATRLGLFQFGQGFSHPVTIRFDDGAPALTENPFFYVQQQSIENGFSQELVVNMEALSRHKNDKEEHDKRIHNGFTYGMTELMLNDLSSGNADKVFSPWVQEGLAIFCSGDGDSLVEEVARSSSHSKATDLVGQLNRTDPLPSKEQWARYYLAIKYILGTRGLNTLQVFVREIAGGNSVTDSILSTLGQDWPTFEKNVRDYSLSAFLKFIPDLGDTNHQ